MPADNFSVGDYPQLLVGLANALNIAELSFSHHVQPPVSGYIIDVPRIVTLYVITNRQQFYDLSTVTD